MRYRSTYCAHCCGSGKHCRRCTPQASSSSRTLIQESVGARPTLLVMYASHGGMVVARAPGGRPGPRPRPRELRPARVPPRRPPPRCPSAPLGRPLGAGTARSRTLRSTLGIAGNASLRRVASSIRREESRVAEREVKLCSTVLLSYPVVL